MLVKSSEVEKTIVQYATHILFYSRFILFHFNRMVYVINRNIMCANFLHGCDGMRCAYPNNVYSRRIKEEINCHVQHSLIYINFDFFLDFIHTTLFLFFKVTVDAFAKCVYLIFLKTFATISRIFLELAKLIMKCHFWKFIRFQRSNVHWLF